MSLYYFRTKKEKERFKKTIKNSLRQYKESSNKQKIVEMLTNSINNTEENNYSTHMAKIFLRIIKLYKLWDIKF